LKIASWNVNSIRVPHAAAREWLARGAPDVICLQETKVVDSEFPSGNPRAAGYSASSPGEKDVQRLAIHRPDAARAGARRASGRRSRIGQAADRRPDRRRHRHRMSTSQNGQEVGSEKYAYKLDWLGRLGAWLEKLRSIPPCRSRLCGDFNIASEDRDVYDADAVREKRSCSRTEHRALGRILAAASPTPSGSIPRRKGSSAGGTIARALSGGIWAGGST